MRPLAIHAAGLVTGVGLDSPSSCAAIRCGISASQETAFINRAGERQLGCAVPWPEPVRGVPRLAAMAASAVKECLAAAAPAKPADLPLLLCVSPHDRPGRIAGLDDELFGEIAREVGATFAPTSAVIAEGRTAIASALRRAERLMYEARAPGVIIAGADTLLTAETLAAYEGAHRILTSQESDGFIPGEAASAVLVGPPRGRGPELACVGIGTGTETATVLSGEPLRAEGLTAAYRTAFADAGLSTSHVYYRLADVSGEQYRFKEAELAVMRSMRPPLNEPFVLWHPAECVGEVGAAIGPCVLAVALDAARRGYAPGPGVMCHFGEDAGARAAILACAQVGRS